MLDAVRAEHFNALIGQACCIETEDRPAFHLTVERVRLYPEARLPGDPPEKREPFAVLLVGEGETGLIDELCSLELPGVGRLNQMRISRTVPQSSDVRKAYYQILFN